MPLSRICQELRASRRKESRDSRFPLGRASVSRDSNCVVAYLLHACVPSIRFSISRNFVASEFSSMDASFRRSPTSVRFSARASAYFMLILYRSVTANAFSIFFSPPGVHLLIMSIHGRRLGSRSWGGDGGRSRALG